ncbi:MAG TPA: type I methionyl aminopeptidase [Thermoanaerobaculia bacterium]|jgi:methionyl aminopeptidase
MTIGSKEDLAGMTRVGRLVGEALREMKAAVRPGMTTAELDAVGAAWLRRQGARSAPQFTYGFPGFNLISVNEEIVHGVPGARRLAPGDVVKIDVTAELGGYIADAAVTVLLPPASPAGRKLRKCVRSAFERGLGAARAGRPVTDIGRAVEGEVRRHGFSVIRNLCGHGVGRTIHEAPQVPNFYDRSVRDVLTEGLVITIEPMVSAAPARTVQEPDGWTVRTHNRSLAAHHEHTIVITRGEPLVLTAA